MQRQWSKNGQEQNKNKIWRKLRDLINKEFGNG
jgi:hypothetical protein